MSRHIPASQLEVREQDIRETEISNASVVVMNFTLQFVDPAERTGLLGRVYRGMQPGGIFLVSEKIYHENPDEGRFHQDMHREFKKANGYSDLEIAGKRAALEKVLVPESRQVHLERLKLAGFQAAFQWFQAFNFVSFAAIR